MPKLSTFADVANSAIGAFQQGQDRAQNNRRLAALAGLGTDLTNGVPERQAGAKALSAGAPLSTFSTLAQLANSDRSFDFQKSRAAVSDQRADRNFDFRQDRAQAQDARSDRAFGLQREKFDFGKRARLIELDLKRSAKTGVNVAGEQKVRKEFQGLTKDFREVRDAFTRIESSAKDPSAAGDLALIFNYMKVLDPGSVVRESEFATAANSAGVPERIRAQYNKVVSGERLSAKTRADFVNRGGQLFKGRLKQYTKTENQFRALAERSGLTPENVVLDLGRSGEQPSTGGNVPPTNVLEEAQSAIQSGADPQAVRQRLIENGYSVDGL